jgi:hypothetical protein
MSDRPRKEILLKKTRLALFGLLACFIAIGAGFSGQAELKSHPDSRSWADLFDAQLSNAIYSQTIWTMAGGELTASQDECIWTEKEYDNFILDLEFKMGEAANSGVIVYCTDLKEWIPNSVEIQILDDYAEKWKGVQSIEKCGGLFGHLAPAKLMGKRAGEWNRMTIACKGTLITVILNGEVTVKADIKKWTSAKTNPDGSGIPSWLSRPMADLRTSGRIGFQGKHGGAPIFFRNIKIKSL